MMSRTPHKQNHAPGLFSPTVRLLLAAAGLFVPLWPFSLTAAPPELAPPAKMSNMGDSISQGFSANNWLGDHPELSFVQGTDSSVNSVFSRYQHATSSSFSEEPVSVSGAEMVGGSDSAAAQASRICAMSTKPNRVVLELGGNDVCNRGSSGSADATANMYSVTTYRNGLKAALDQLGGCLPTGSLVHVLSMPRVDYLREAGVNKSFWCRSVWSLAGICRIVTGETDANRRRQVGARIDQYNDGLQQEVTGADGRFAGRVHFSTDWQGSLGSHPNTSVGTYLLSSDDIDTADCFHPYYGTGQRKLACTAWESGELGDKNHISACLK